jgi:hypothetical protein
VGQLDPADPGWDSVGIQGPLSEAGSPLTVISGLSRRPAGFRRAGANHPLPKSWVLSPRAPLAGIGKRRAKQATTRSAIAPR